MTTLAAVVERLEPQAALEQAVANAICANLGYAQSQCDRTFDAKPNPSMGNMFVSVWHTADRAAGESGRQSLSMRFGVNITVTVRIVQPADRWVKHRDHVEKRLNAIAALVHRDGQQRNICNAAALLADYDSVATRPVGFREGLKFLRYGPIEEKFNEWFSATQGKDTCGVAQTAFFGDALRVQAVATAS